jgi:hypothetical protein
MVALRRADIAKIADTPGGLFPGHSVSPSSALRALALDGTDGARRHGQGAGSAGPSAVARKPLLRQRPCRIFDRAVA